MSLLETREPQWFSRFLQYGSNIAAREGQALPRLDADALAGALRRLTPDELQQSLHCKLIPLVTLPGLRLFAACGPQALAEAQRQGLEIAATADKSSFAAAVRTAHGAGLLRQAVWGLHSRTPHYSASRRLTRWQAGVMAMILLIAAATLAVLPGMLGWMLASSVAGLFFLSVVALRILCLLPPIRRQPGPGVEVADAALPVYSVLVPLFRETSVLGQLLSALTSLDYPADKLDIKLILEESDTLMQRALAAIRLPAAFEVITVPSGTPQTKPRALNYALPFCRGSFLTIFDAEDIPDPRQLRLAASAFAAGPPHVACLQAQLHFYNPIENWLARQFTIEYATLFEALLPALSNHRLPLLLGGTSNHFRIGVLRRIGGWDPHNVTEDADLGLRLAREGYETGALDSRTYEEANVKLANWIKQRARWLKGFLATWLVHMREPLRLWREVGPAAFWTIQATTIGVFASALLHPLCMAVTAALLVLTPQLPADAGVIVYALAGLNLLILAAGYGVSMYIAGRVLRRRGISGWYLAIATMPLYWLLMSAAAWFALWQFISAPFYWNKTEHGLSHVQRARRRKARDSDGRDSPPLVNQF